MAPANPRFDPLPCHRDAVRPGAAHRMSAPLRRPGERGSGEDLHRGEQRPCFGQWGGSARRAAPEYRRLFMRSGRLDLQQRHRPIVVNVSRRPFRRNSAAGRRIRIARLTKRIRFLIPVAVVASSPDAAVELTSSPAGQANSKLPPPRPIRGPGRHSRQPDVPALQQPRGGLLDQIPRGLGPEGLRQSGHLLGQGQQRPDRRYAGRRTDGRVGGRRAPEGGRKGPDAEAGHASTGEGRAQQGDSRRLSRPRPGRSSDRQEAHVDGGPPRAREQGPRRHR